MKNGEYWHNIILLCWDRYTVHLMCQTAHLVEIECPFIKGDTFWMGMSIYPVSVLTMWSRQVEWGRLDTQNTLHYDMCQVSAGKWTSEQVAQTEQR